MGRCKIVCSYQKKEGKETPCCYECGRFEECKSKYSVCEKITFNEVRKRGRKHCKNYISDEKKS